MKNERPAALVLDGGSWELGGLPNKCRVFSLGKAVKRKKLELGDPLLRETPLAGVFEAPLRSFLETMPPLLSHWPSGIS